MTDSSPSESNNNNENNHSKKNSSWFSSWFENDHDKMKQDIHRRLNQWDDHKAQVQQDNERRRKQFEDFFGMPHAQNRQYETTSDPFSQLESQLENLFYGTFQPEAFGVPGDQSSRSSVRHFGSMASYRMTHDSRSGTELEIEVPKNTKEQDISVQVLEPECHVQWQIAKQQPAQVRLGDAVDCSQVSAHLDQARYLLKIQAPVQSQPDLSNARSIPVTEFDLDDEDY